MFRLILIIILFVMSLLNFFPVPSKEVWYAGIAVPEFPWVFILFIIPLIIWSGRRTRYKKLSLTLSMLALISFTYPIIGAYILGNNLNKKLIAAFGAKANDNNSFQQTQPFSLLQMIAGNNHVKKIGHTRYIYSTANDTTLDLNFYPSATAGIRPCLVVVHGGSWKRGNNTEIANANEYFASQGYQVASINYGLSPKHQSPSMQNDLKAAMAWLRANASTLKIDTTSFVLMGRSAGGQIVLTYAYTANDKAIKGVAGFYAPIDLLWSYDNPDNPLIMDSKEVQRDFLGGTPTQVRNRYLAESAIYNVTPQSPPTLLVHGKQDAHVWQIQSKMLSEKLTKNGVPNFALLLPWATHGCEFNLNGPSGQLSMYCVERFFAAVTSR